MKLFAYLKQNKIDPPEFETRETMIKIKQRIGVCVLAVVQDQINSSQAKARSKCKACPARIHLNKQISI